ncbi:MAG: hypothetical protein HY824_14590 [Acidobacteria bacterium]|nr:hypothetical protein [Acidobacteriota bacterium]
MKHHSVEQKHFIVIGTMSILSGERHNLVLARLGSWRFLVVHANAIGLGETTTSCGESADFGTMQKVHKIWNLLAPRRMARIR